MKLNKRHLALARIKLLPLIDVFFLLAIFFIFIILKMPINSMANDFPPLVKGKQHLIVPKSNSGFVFQRLDNLNSTGYNVIVFLTEKTTLSKV